MRDASPRSPAGRPSSPGSSRRGSAGRPPSQIHCACSNVASVSYASPGRPPSRRSRRRRSTRRTPASARRTRRGCPAARARRRSRSGSSVSASSSLHLVVVARRPVESAFWKIVGFDVTPVTASSSIIRFSSPVWTRSRESVSIQTDCPRAASSCSRDFAILHLPFHLGDLLQARDVALAAVEGRARGTPRRARARATARRPPSRGRARSCRRARRPGARCRCRGRSPRGCPSACRRRPRRRRRSRRRGRRARRRRAGSPRRPRAPCRGSRSAPRRCPCRGRPPRALTSAFEHRVAQMHAAVVERDRDLHRPRPVRSCPRRT